MEYLLKYHDLQNDFPVFFYQRVKKEGLNKQDITVMVKSQQQLKDLESRVNLSKHSNLKININNINTSGIIAISL